MNAKKKVCCRSHWLRSLEICTDDLMLARSELLKFFTEYLAVMLFALVTRGLDDLHVSNKSKRFFQAAVYEVRILQIAVSQSQPLPEGFTWGSRHAQPDPLRLFLYPTSR